MTTIIQNGTRYATVNETGQITRLDGANGKGSDSWRVVGAARLNNFGYTVEWFTLADVLTLELQWRHKNGSQRIHLVDDDHGTRRMWMNPTHSIA